MKLVIVCQESPYPPRHGGTIDMWRRLTLLKNLGVEVFLVCWSEDPESVKQNLLLKACVSELVVFGYQRSLSFRLTHLIKYFEYPSPIVSRWLDSTNFNDLLERICAFKPKYLFQDGLMSAKLVMDLSHKTKIPYLVRSHNVEYLYWKKQLRLTTGLKQIKSALRLINLEKIERTSISQSTAFFDISSDDLNYWRDQGFKNGFLMLPLMDISHNKSKFLENEKPEYDLAFIGNLRMPNNVDGLTWFVNDVLPQVKNGLGRDVSLLIAGSSPVQEVYRLANMPNVKLVANFDEFNATASLAKILINPVLQGSGVALKSIDMLLTGKSVVSTPQGGSGLPDDVKYFLNISRNSEEFAKNVIELILKTPAPDSFNKQLDTMRIYFGEASIEPLMRYLKDTNT